MIAWEWTIEKAREGEEEKTEKKKTRKISQSAQVEERSGWRGGVMMGWGAARIRGGNGRGWGQAGGGVRRRKKAGRGGQEKAQRSRKGESIRLKNCKEQRREEGMTETGP